MFVSFCVSISLPFIFGIFVFQVPRLAVLLVLIWFEAAPGRDWNAADQLLVLHVEPVIIHLPWELDARDAALRAPCCVGRSLQSHHV